ncbi:hypothetical protein ACOJBM_40720 [Rhizobium beringeri]
MTDFGEPLGCVTESTPSLIRIEVDNPSKFETHKERLSVGQYLLIASGNTLYLLSTIVAIRASHIDKPGEESVFRFHIDTQPIGTWSQDGGFTRGSHALPVPTEFAYVAPAAVLAEIFSAKLGSAFLLARSALRLT